LFGLTDDHADQRECERAFQAVHRYSLLIADGNALGMHRLLQETIRTGLPKVDRERIVVDLLGRMGQLLKVHDTSYRATAAFKRLAPHALSVAQHADNERTATDLVTEVRQMVAAKYARAGLLGTSLHLFEGVLRRDQSRGAGLQEASIRSELGLVYRRLGMPKESHAQYRVALQLSSEEASVAAKLLRGHIHCGLLMLAEQSGRLDEATEHLNIVSTIANDIGDEILDIKARHCSGRLSLWSRDFPKARGEFSAVLRASRPHRDWPQRFDVLLDLAFLDHVDPGRRPSARHLVTALRIARRSEDLLTHAAVLHDISVASWLQGGQKAAIAWNNLAQHAVSRLPREGLASPRTLQSPPSNENLESWWVLSTQIGSPADVRNLIVRFSETLVT
jgi:hypothetical protein